MVIVKIWGGLGNQMFLYALYRSFLAEGKECKIDVSYYDYSQSHNGYELETVFRVGGNYASRQEVLKLANIKMDLFNRLIRKFIYQKKTYYIQDLYAGFGFNDKILEMDHSYLQGYFQSEKYFHKITDTLKVDFEFKPRLDEINLRIANEMQRCNSVSIHVRRGDYLQPANSGFGGVCTLGYYQNAIKKIESMIENPSYYIFSDDLNWCRKNLSLKNCRYVDGNSGGDSYKDMQMMSYCKHNIIANSSFSWWGAWLNNNAEKIVIAPNKWFHDARVYADDIVPESWQKVST